jgi:hypothetical protein
VRTKRSAKAFARGERTGVRMVSTPIEANTSSKLEVNLVSRSRMRNRKRRPCWVRKLDARMSCGSVRAVGEVAPVVSSRGRHHRGSITDGPTGTRPHEEEAGHRAHGINGPYRFADKAVPATECASTGIIRLIETSTAPQSVGPKR